MSNENKSKETVFMVLFVVFTVLCWCPVGYGSYGPVGRIMGIPSWAFILLLVGAILFVIEWVYLFVTDLALNDDDLEEIISALQADTNPKTQVKEG